MAVNEKRFTIQRFGSFFLSPVGQLFMHHVSHVRLVPWDVVVVVAVLFTLLDHVQEHGAV